MLIVFDSKLLCAYSGPSPTNDAIEKSAVDGDQGPRRLGELVEKPQPGLRSDRSQWTQQQALALQDGPTTIRRRRAPNAIMVVDNGTASKSIRTQTASRYKIGTEAFQHN